LLIASCFLVIQVHLSVGEALGNRPVIKRVAIVLGRSLLGLMAVFEGSLRIAHEPRAEQVVLDNVRAFLVSGSARAGHAKP